MTVGRGGLLVGGIGLLLRDGSMSSVSDWIYITHSLRISQYIF